MGISRTVAKLLSVSLTVLLIGCGGGGSGTNSSNPSPLPSSSPAPTPSPIPSDTGTGFELSYQYVFNLFEGDGMAPNQGLMRASDGNLYGATLGGGHFTCGYYGDAPCGTLFRIDQNGAVTIFHKFNEIPDDGNNPVGPLIQGEDGALYGVTASGGERGGAGVVFRISLAGEYSILHHFGQSPDDGFTPQGGLVRHPNGWMYGTTARGGPNDCIQIPEAGFDCGVVFRINESGVYEQIYDFGQSTEDGAQPNAPLLVASDGNLYGTARLGGKFDCGGPNSCGSFFRISPTGNFDLLHSFGQTSEDPIAPNGVMQATDGNIYGTSLSGGNGRCNSNYGCGTVFRFNLAGDIKVIYRFALDGHSDGSGPGRLVQASDGILYGTTGSGGLKGAGLAGTIFSMTLEGRKSILYSFEPIDQPHNPSGPLLEMPDGTFRGMTRYSGNLGVTGARQGAGTIFKLSKITN